MLSYRHAYHAGNFADVMKHLVLVAMLRYLVRKDAALCYIDTHAGAGSYDLTSSPAQKTGESILGIAKLWATADAPELVSDYLSIVRGFNTAESLARYPGSPRFAARLLRPQDRLVLCELHSSDFPLLERLFSRDGRVHCHEVDGYRFCKGLVPPAERRGLVFMDPSYELHDEYATALAALGRMHRQFSTGTYALWYPILDEQRTLQITQHFKRLNIRDILHVALRIADSKSYPGMYGSGMVVINPPWTLQKDMEATLPWLAARLGINDRASWTVEQWVDE